MSQAVTTFPARRRHWRSVEHDLIAFQRDHQAYEGGVFERYWPAAPSEVYLGARAAFSLYAHTNLFSMNDLPGLGRVERELRTMIGEILELPEAGAVTLTSGGTESNFLAVKAARRLFRERGVTAPNIVIPYTGHPSFDKAGDELSVEVRRIDVRPDFRADAAALEAAIDENTIMVVGSAPSYPQGVVDPIAEIAEVAARHDVWMHVDACVGGFLVPFLRELGAPLPAFSFELDGVWSIAADLHKFGWCLNGISTLSVRDAALQELHTFTLGGRGWPYRGYARVGFVGSRPGGTIAAAWAVLQLMGRDGYLDVARGVIAAGERIARRVEQIDGLTMLTPPEAGVAVIAPTSDLEVEALAAGLLEEGWDVATGATPPTIHLLLGPLPDEQVDAFLAALARVTARVSAGELTGRREGAYGD